MSGFGTVISAAFAALALLATAKACCLPEKFAINFIGEIEADEHGVKKTYNITGIIGAEFARQKFIFQYKVLNSPVTKLWILEPSKGEFLYTRRVNYAPSVCYVIGRIDGLLGKDYRCFLGNKKIVETTGRTYKLRLGRSMKVTGFFNRSSKNDDICELQGQQTFSISTGFGKALRVRLFETRMVTEFRVDFYPTCTDRRPLSQKGLAIPSMAVLSKMSGKGIAAMFTKLWPAEESGVLEVKTTTAEPTTTTEPTRATPTTTSPKPKGRYVWNGDSWKWVADGDVVGSGSGSGDDDDDDDDNTDGTVVGGNGSGSGDTDDEFDEVGVEDDTSESEEIYVNNTGEGDVDGDGDYDDYDRDYWEYYWKDEDESIAEWEVEYHDAR